MTVALCSAGAAQGPRSKSLRGSIRQQGEVQCVSSGFQPPRAGSCGARSTHNSARRGGARGRSRDIRRSNPGCINFQAKCANDQIVILSSCDSAEKHEAPTSALTACTTFDHRPSVGSWYNTRSSLQDRAIRKAKQEPEQDWEGMISSLRLRASAALFEACEDGSLHNVLAELMQERPSKPEDEENYKEASSFVSGLLQEAVDDYSDDMVHEIIHKNLAPQVFDVPEPTIPEEDEAMLEDEEEQLGFGKAALEYAIPDDIYDAEDAVSVVSCTNDVEEDGIGALEMAEELVWTEPEQADSRLENIRSAMKEILEEAFDNGQLVNMLTELQQARKESRPLPSASSLPACTRPRFARQLRPQTEGAPVMEEPFPCDCLPPSTPVALSSAPRSPEVDDKACFQKLQAHENFCRGIASTNLQFLYREASKNLANDPSVVVPTSTPEPEPVPVPPKASTIDEVLAKARNVLITAVNTGRLEKAVEEVVQEKENASFERVRDKMRFTLCNAMEDGRLQAALREYKFERVCQKARDVLVTAAAAGTLEVAVREISTRSVSNVAVVTPSPEILKTEGSISMPPAPPTEGSPSRRRFSAARNLVTASEGVPTVHPSPPSKPRVSRPGSRPTNMLSGSSGPESPQPAAPVPPQTPAPGVRRPARSSTGSVELAGTKMIVAPPRSSSIPPGPLRPSCAKRATSQPPEQASCVAASADDTFTTPRWGIETLETLRQSKAVGTGLLPMLPSTSHTAASAAYRMGLEHSAVQQKLTSSSHLHASSTF